LLVLVDPDGHRHLARGTGGDHRQAVPALALGLDHGLAGLPAAPVGNVHAGVALEVIDHAQGQAAIGLGLRVLHAIDVHHQGGLVGPGDHQVDPVGVAGQGVFKGLLPAAVGRALRAVGGGHLQPRAVGLAEPERCRRLHPRRLDLLDLVLEGIQPSGPAGLLGHLAVAVQGVGRQVRRQHHHRRGQAQVEVPRDQQPQRQGAGSGDQVGGVAPEAGQPIALRVLVELGSQTGKARQHHQQDDGLVIAEQGVRDRRVREGEGHGDSRNNVLP
jgi:hypothetical protein